MGLMWVFGLAAAVTLPALSAVVREAEQVRALDQAGVEEAASALGFRAETAVGKTGQGHANPRFWGEVLGHRAAIEITAAGTTLHASGRGQSLLRVRVAFPTPLALGQAGLGTMPAGRRQAVAGMRQAAVERLAQWEARRVVFTDHQFLVDFEPTHGCVALGQRLSAVAHAMRGVYRARWELPATEDELAQRDSLAELAKGLHLRTGLGGLSVGGAVAGMRVSVASEFVGAALGTRLRFAFWPLPFELSMVDSDLSARLRRRSELRLGDDVFDARFIVQGTPEHRVRAALDARSRASLAAVWDAAQAVHSSARTALGSNMFDVAWPGPCRADEDPGRITRLVHAMRRAHDTLTPDVTPSRSPYR